MRFCHTDIHGWNLMVKDDSLILIDWEGLKIAPAEMDIMFVIDKAYAEKFLQHIERRIGVIPSMSLLLYFINSDEN
jgi:thiamine kinase-like enzyme